MATSGALSTTNQYIKYKITVTQNSQSLANNTSNVTVSVRFYRTNDYQPGTYGTGTIYCRIDGTTYSAAVSSDQVINNSGIVLFSRTMNVAHKADGTKTLEVVAWINHSQFSSGEQGYWQTLTQIKRKSTLTVSAGTLGAAQTLTINRQSSDFYHRIKYTCGSASANIAPSGSDKITDASVSWTPPLSLASQSPNSAAVSVKLTLYTYAADGTELGTNETTVNYSIPASVAPSISLAIADAAGYVGSYGGYIQSRSRVFVSLVALGAYGSTIRSYKTTVDGRTYTDAEFESTALSSSGTLTISATVTDSRGRTATKTQNITVVPYAPPKVTAISAHRSNADGSPNATGDYLLVSFKAEGVNVGNANNIAYSLGYKKTSASSYTTVNLSTYANNFAVTSGEYVIAADAASSYDIMLTAADDFATATRSTSGGTASVLYSKFRGGLGWAFGKVAEIANAFESAWDAYFRKDVHVDGLIYDQYGLPVRNGMSAYQTAAEGMIDPNTTTEELILTSHENGPMGAGTFYYIKTVFYGGKSATAYRAQYGMPYNKNGSLLFRRYDSNGWSAWRRCFNADELADYIVEQGTDGIWNYRKWNSGIAECWGGTSLSFSGNAVWVDGWYYATSAAVDFPSGLFTAAPILNWNKSSYSSLEVVTIGGGSLTATTTPTFRIARPSQYTSAASRLMQFRAVGRWK